MQPGICDRLSRRYRARLPDPASRCHRFSGHSVERITFLLAERFEREEDSTYITKKVSDRLQSIFKNDRKEFEEKWDDLKIFINYGMLTQEDFYEKASKFALFKDTDNKYYTFEDTRH